jgi:hypothetical protein
VRRPTARWSHHTYVIIARAGGDVHVGVGVDIFARLVLVVMVVVLVLVFSVRLHVCLSIGCRVLMLHVQYSRAMLGA